MSNLPYFKIVKNVDMILKKVQLSLELLNVVEGPGKSFKFSNGNKILDYFVTQGTTIVSNVIEIIQNGMYAIYLRDDRGFEWKESILINDIIADDIPILNTINKEYLIPFLSKGATGISVNYTHQEIGQMTSLEMIHNGLTYSSSQQETPAGANLNKTYVMDLTDIAEINQKLNVLFKLVDQNNNISTENSNIIEIYNPNLSATSSINSIEIEWNASKLTDVEYILKRDSLEIYRGSTVNFIDLNVSAEQNYFYELEVVHNGNIYSIQTVNKLSGNFSFDVFGDIQMETKMMSDNAFSLGESIGSNVIGVTQNFDIQNDFNITMTMTPFTSVGGGIVSASYFKIEDALLKDESNNTISMKDIFFIDDIASTLISNEETMINKKAILEISLNNLKLFIPPKLKLNDFPSELFTSTVTYQMEWGP
jgi:hypothetical protein